MRFNYATRFLRAGAAVCGLACFSISALSAADNAPFRPKPATEYPNAQKTSGLVIAAEAYSTEEQTKVAFGKLNPNKYGVLPVLLLMSNQSGKVLRLEKMRIEYITRDKQNIESVPASEVHEKRDGSPAVKERAGSGMAAESTKALPVCFWQFVQWHA